MHIGKLSKLNRRAFLRRSGQLAATGTAAAYAMDLASISEASATSVEDYKALVCVFLYGGNDHANTLIPYDATNYSRYQSARSTVAVPRDRLAATRLAQSADDKLTDDITFALAPDMPRLAARFNSGQLALLLNVGPLIAPLTKSQFESSNTQSYPRPAKLFSHNDQQSTWQSFSPEGARTGWGGRIADRALSSNTNSMFTAINATGNAVFLSGELAAPFKVTQAGATQILGLESLYGSRSAGAALGDLLTTHHSHIFEQDYTAITQRSIEYSAFINEGLANANLNTPFDNQSSLSEQLSVVARLIGARKSLGVKRQVFLVSLGGFDTHTNLLARHAALLGQLDAALDAFYNAMTELGVANQVTTFTASDFGRTLTSNGDGSDHGWGGHQFVLGGDVDGGRFFGTAPSISTTSGDQVGRGRLLPSTSVDQFSTTLALWFGVPPSELSSIAPNIGRFSTSDLGFMRERVVST